MEQEGKNVRGKDRNLVATRVYDREIIETTGLQSAMRSGGTLQGARGRRKNGDVLISKRATVSALGKKRHTKIFTNRFPKEKKKGTIHYRLRKKEKSQKPVPES